MASAFVIGAKTHVFFDDRRLRRGIGKANFRNLKEVGRRMRKRAKKSMKLAPAGKASTAGQPPHAHRRTEENPSGGGLKKSILFAYDKMRKSVVAGPSTIYGRNIAVVATRQEFGGMVRERNPRRVVRKRGDGGELRWKRKMPSKKNNRIADQQKGFKLGQVDTLQGKVFVAYGKLRTQRMADRANRIQKELYGPIQIQSRLKKRPYMRPQLRKVRREIPSIWKDSVK